MVFLVSCIPQGIVLTQAGSIGIGCSLKRLWIVLTHELPIKGLKSLNPVAKQLIWEHGLLHQCNDIHVLVKTELMQEFR